MRYIKLFGIGLVISWLGALPLGVLNVTAFDIASHYGLFPALSFSIAAIVVELIYVALALFGSKKWRVPERWIGPLLLLGALITCYLGIGSLLKTPEITPDARATEWYAWTGSPIVLGIVLSAINPLQFPFWLGWNKVLSRKGLLKHSSSHYFTYLFGIGLGSFLALSLFAWMGLALIKNIEVFARYSNLIIGIIYLGISAYIAIIFLKRRPKPIHQ